MVAIRQLYELQLVDLALDSRRTRLGAIAAALGDQSSLGPFKKRTLETGRALQAATAKQGDIDAAIAGVEEKITAAEGKLYGGSVNASRELRDLQADIEMLKRQRGEREDHLLEVLEEVDSTKEAFDKARSALFAKDKAWKADQKSMAQEKAVLEQEVADLQKQREGRVPGITAADLSLYEQMRKSHKGVAIALMHHNMCEGCRVGLNTRQAIDAKSGATVVRCPNCGLILLAE